jgi:superfamily I DNA and/or RNA helicase
VSLRKTRWFYFKVSVRPSISLLALRFCLGPPGTGKTTVIVALVKAILQKYTTLQSKSGVELGWGKKSSETDGQHILVCAPSNAAADELTGRLVSANIKVRFPISVHCSDPPQAIPESVQYPVVRYGNNFTSDSLAETVSLDKLTSYVQPSLLRTGSQHESATTQPSSHERRSMQVSVISV